MKQPKDLPLHFVGIGGIGMSGIAEVMLRQGYPVSGSDLSDTTATQRLKSLGAKISLGHQAENVHGSVVVVYSSAVDPSNPEMVEARRLKLPTIPRAEMLAEIMRGKTAISVAGTHGKTTTTSMIATIMNRSGWDPTVVIGGRLDSIGGNAKLGVSPYVVAEADESDGSFLKLPSTYAVVTNIDSDHMDHYASLADIDHAFIEFVNHLPFYGQAWVCGDDPGVQRCLARFSKPFKTYGFGENCSLRALSYISKEMGSETQLSDGTVIRLSVPGKHNALNALAAFGICQDLGMETNQIVQAIEQYYGVKRRFEIKWQSDQNQIIVDDYAHHPVEIRATLAAARSYFKTGKIKAVFQPHRYSRTLHCLEAFKSAFLDADEIWITPIYAAGESPVAGLDHHTVVAAVNETARSGQQVIAIDTVEEAMKRMRSEFKNDEMILFMGAGSITRVADEFVSQL